MTEGKFSIHWIDQMREPQCAPDLNYPDGIDVVLAAPGVATCKADLPYPAPRCGAYFVKCEICGRDALITTAGRRDDPRSVELGCGLATGKSQ
jgi:hypothetical protein